MSNSCVSAVKRVVGFAAIALACLAPTASANESLVPADIRLTEVVDLNPDPRILEIDMEARVATVEIEPGLEVEA